MQVERADLRPTGPEQRSLVAQTWQHRLNRRLGTHDTPQDQQCLELLAELIPNVINDSFLPSLTKRLGNLDRAGFDTSSLVQSAAAKAPLPDDHPGSRSVVAHSGRTAPAAAKQFTSNNPSSRTPERYET
jgi:hypothetical protein